MTEAELPLSVSAFLRYLQLEKRYSAHTVLSYRTDLESFFKFLSVQYGPLELPEISHPIIRGWLASLKEEDNAARTINRKISTLRSFFKYHLRQGNVSAVPTGSLISPKVSKRLPVFVRESETKALIETLNTSSDDWKSLNAKMLITLFYATGMRLSELIGLKEQQVDKGRGHLRVLGKGNKERLLPLSAELFSMIEEYISLKRKEFGSEELHLLVTEKGRKLYPKYAYLLVKEYLGKASTLDKRSPHVLRHTFATHLLNNGADLNAVKELLGHASLAATQVYTHNTIEKLRDVHKKAHPRG